MKIVEGLYAYPWRGTDNNCNSYVFAGVLKDGGHVVVDPGHFTTPMYREAGLDQLFEGMSRDGIDGARTGLVILTHGHPDHCESSIILRQEYHSLVALHEADEPTYKMMGGKVDVFLEEGELNLGNGPYVLRHFLVMEIEQASLDEEGLVRLRQAVEFEDDIAIEDVVDALIVAGVEQVAHAAETER